MRLDISDEAERDLSEILEYSLQQWGVVRAFGYVEDLTARMDALAAGSLSGVKAAGMSATIRRPVAGSHVIWSRIDGDLLRVVRVLHQGRDAGRWVDRGGTLPSLWSERRRHPPPCAARAGLRPTAPRRAQIAPDTPAAAGEGVEGCRRVGFATLNMDG